MDELQPYSTKNPARSKLLFGQYKVRHEVHSGEEVRIECMPQWCADHCQDMYESKKIRAGSGQDTLFPQVVYASAPSAPGAFLSGPSGPIPASDTLPVEVIEQDGSYSSTVEFKDFGIIPASFERSGRVRASGGNTYTVSFRVLGYA